MKAWVPIIGLALATASCHRAPTQGAAASTSTVSSAAAILDAMDTRVPVPLVPMMAQHQKEDMRGHLTAVQQIVSAVASNDFDGITRAAGTIGYSPEMGHMCTHMGAAAPGFTDQALRFHHSADIISEAARAHDMQGVLSALNATLANCTGCHSTFKQHVVDETTWASLAGQAAPQHP